ncbi:PsbB mRNA maturation factor Mbb1, chloroplastic [Porphyridium purpureum]|uniref:PsbB mRNA maturation factor Mbb1, chloroplastic n=1 Tax=Porphyridium purpureum TaxID=35688 RepID=A0A5J4YY57_PORPP|nr:PsbB mRNA maturation factor Mbb1, chloroplastic [Porphyridium purpureum]|eukprot:POR1392..scf209_3
MGVSYGSASLGSSSVDMCFAGVAAGPYGALVSEQLFSPLRARRRSACGSRAGWERGAWKITAAGSLRRKMCRTCSRCGVVRKAAERPADEVPGSFPAAESAPTAKDSFMRASLSSWAPEKGVSRPARYGKSKEEEDEAWLKQMTQLVEERLLSDEQLPLDGRDRIVSPQASLGSGGSLKINVDLAHSRARSAVKRAQLDEAARLFRRCVELNRYDARGWLGLARIEFRRKNYEEMRRVFSAALKLLRKSPYLLQAWGVLEQKLGNIDRAKELLLAATKADPKHAASWVATGVLEMKILRNPSRARECLETATRVGEDNHYAWVALGELERSAGNLARARECYERACSIKPENVASWHAWGNLEAACGNLKQAEKLFLRAMTEHPQNTQALTSWAHKLASRGMLQKARSLYTRALQVQPRDKLIYQALGVVLSRLHEYDEARKAFETGIMMDNSHCPLYQAWAGMEAKLGNIDKARELYQQGVWAAPRSPSVIRIWLAWGILESQLGNIDTARDYFQLGLRIDKHNPYILNSYAKMEALAGELERARELFELAVESNPHNMRIWRDYEHMEMRAGNFQLAANIRDRSIGENYGGVQGTSSPLKTGRAKPALYRVPLAEPQAGDFQNSMGAWTESRALKRPAPLFVLSARDVALSESGEAQLLLEKEKNAAAARTLGPKRPGRRRKAKKN